MRLPRLPVAVDDVIGDAVDDRDWPAGEQVRALLEVAPDVAEVRRLVVPHGDDEARATEDHATLTRAIKAAQEARVLVYPVAIVTPLLDIKSLRRLATATGGQLSFAKKSSDVDRLYRTLARKIAATRTYSYLRAAHSYQALHIVVSMKGHGTDRFVTRPAHPGSRPKPQNELRAIDDHSRGARSCGGMSAVRSRLRVTRIFSR